MQSQKKIRSVLELARYQIGDVAWWVILRPIKPLPELKDDEQWMLEPHIHPKSLYRYGPYSGVWPPRTQLPKLQHTDFNFIVGLLTSKLKIEEFKVVDYVRSNDTGEFFYANEQDEWIPESNLLDTKVAARRERARTLKLMKQWITNNS